MKYRKKLISVFCVAILFTLLIQFGRINIRGNNTSAAREEVVRNDTPTHAVSESVMKEGQKKALIITNLEDDMLVEDTTQMQRNLMHMRMDAEIVSEFELEYINYSKYDLIILGIMDYAINAENYIYDLIDYARKGGNLLIGYLALDINGVFASFYRQLGIKYMSEYKITDGLSFPQDLIPNVQKIKLDDAENLSDTYIQVLPEESSDVYLSSLDGDPLYWTSEIGSGRVGYYNLGNLGEKYNSGIFAGVVATLMDDFIYPIINAKTVFIDDFPSPHYNNESEEIKEEYNRTIKEFYRDIWWPDMQRLAKQKDLVYTGLFVSTFNDVVNPDDFVFEDSRMMKYFGQGLLKNDYEIGLQGYNHQPLALEGYVPKDVDVVPWDNIEDMRKSIEVLERYAKELFPNSIFKTYVPPSNYLSPEGRAILPLAMPDLEVISGVFVSEGNATKTFEQDFDVANDGIVNYPRLSVGMWNDSKNVYENLAGLGLYGAFSHFIQPDDILDEERGRNALWSELLESFEGMLERTSDKYSALRSLTASQSAEATRVYDALDVMSKYTQQGVEVALNDFLGEAYFYLRTAHKPLLRGEGYELTPMSEHYYLVKATSNSFTIRWEE